MVVDVEGKSTFALASAIFASQLSTSYNIAGRGKSKLFLKSANPKILGLIPQQQIRKFDRYRYASQQIAKNVLFSTRKFRDFKGG
jgi:hypothetical protein